MVERLEYPYELRYLVGWGPWWSEGRGQIKGDSEILMNKYNLCGQMLPQLTHHPSWGSGDNYGGHLFWSGSSGFLLAESFWKFSKARLIGKILRSRSRTCWLDFMHFWLRNVLGSLRMMKKISLGSGISGFSFWTCDLCDSISQSLK